MRPEPSATPPVRTHLERGNLTLRDQLVMAVTSVAPAYSIGLAMAALAAAVGALSPIAVIIGFLPNFGMAVAYYQLNRENPNCGTAYAWVGATFGRTAGFLAGWVAVLQAVIALAFATPFAGQVTIDFLNRLHIGFGMSTTDLYATTIVGALWMIAVTLVVVRGIRMTARLQYVLLGTEFAIVLLLSVVGIFKGGASPFEASWFDPTSFPSASAFAGGMVVAVFLYAGWNTPTSLNEETEDQHDAPGRAPLIGLVILLATFVLAAVSIQMTVGVAGLEQAGTQTLNVWAATVFGSWFAPIAVFALLTSTLAVLQTTLLPTARFTFSMGRDGVISSFWTKVHPRYGTPWASSLTLTAVVAAIALLNLVLDDLNTIVLAGVIVSGVLLSFFYAATGVACAVRFRREAMKSPRIFVWAVAVPLLSSAMLFALAGYLLKTDWTSTSTFAFDGSNGRFQVVFAGVVLVGGLLVALVLRATRWRSLEPFGGAATSAPEAAFAAEEVGP